jgi:RsiW-degrading membrane proteinase PrsW (M82 family)
MSATIKCECGKANLIPDGLEGQQLFCIRCSRELEPPRFVRPRPQAGGAYDLIAPPADDPRLLEEEQLVELTGPAPPVPPRSPREQVYWLLPLALFPLAWSLGQPKDDTIARYNRTIDAQPAEVRQLIEQLRLRNSSLDAILSQLPGRRIEGSYLPRDTRRHWEFAGASTAWFLLIGMLLFARGSARGGTLLAVGLFTGTVGVVWLLSAQAFFPVSHHEVFHETDDFTLHLFGYVILVGGFEELAKALPLLWRFRTHGPLRWRSACVWGLASGVGFGVSEGVFYSANFYNGLSTGDAYVVRFASCVVLHGIWTASFALSQARHWRSFLSRKDRLAYGGAVLRSLAVPATLHGLYDTFLQHELHLPALFVAGVSFAWLVWQIEAAKGRDVAVAPEAVSVPT